MDCSNCCSRPGDRVTLRLDGRDGVKNIEIALCDECERELLAEEWVSLSPRASSS